MGSQVTELNLDNCKGCTAVEGLTDEFVNLHTLSLIGSGLTSLKGFPKLAKLKKVWNNEFAHFEIVIL